jgi:hypothetical protein
LRRREDEELDCDRDDIELDHDGIELDGDLDLDLEHHLPLQWR